MMIREFAGAESQDARLAALAKFLDSRAEDKNTRRKISVSAFLSLAQNLGIAVTAEQLRDMALKPPLDGIIANVENDEITFRGGDDEATVSAQMSVDQAQNTVDSMAKRATGNAMKGLR
jgi:hypothetical protein